MILIVYDFDQTITKKHTFLKSGLLQVPDAAKQQESYERGKAEAPANIKNGLSKARFESNKDRIVTIATHHNNSHLIAGYLAHIMGAELVFKELLLSKQTPKTAIAEFTVAGSDSSFLISYLHAFANDFQTTITKVEGKNFQIEFLQETLLSRNQLDANHSIKLYDDAVFNLARFSQHFANGSCHSVHGQNDDFKVLMHQHTAGFLICQEEADEGSCLNLDAPVGSSSG